MEKLNFFVVEGLDGVGKTTLINNLDKLGYKTFKTPSSDYSCLRKKVHDLNKASLFFYLSSLEYLIEKEAKDLNNFVVDRYLFSTIANYAYNNALSLKDVKKLFDEFFKFLPIPKITFFLVLDFEERMKRVNKRGHIERQFDNLDIEYDKYISNMIVNYDYSKKVIINAKKSEKEVLEEVIFYLKELDE